jgi:predicted transcriptional regulator of viral defense system
LALSINGRGYLSHATAVLLHGLTDLVPKMVYLNVEQSPKPSAHGQLTQRGIDQAFARKQRQSNMTYDCDDWSVTVINGKHTNQLGVVPVHGPASELLKATDLERTLIDIVVRPAYSGGIFQVMAVYRAAKNRLSTNRLISTLKKLNYLYPYHQAIGFLMEKAGYEERRYTLLQKLGIEHNFYLVHGMQNPSFSQKWKLFFPEGL